MPKTCLEILYRQHCDHKVPSGVYEIDPDGQGPFKVFCDMETDGGGWTVFQRRQDGSVDFYRIWNDYKSGFGNLLGEFWQGNDKIHRMTAATPHKLRVDMEDFEFNTRYAEYRSFSIADEGLKYKLTVSGHHGNAGDSFSSTYLYMVFMRLSGMLWVNMNVLFKNRVLKVFNNWYFESNLYIGIIISRVLLSYTSYRGKCSAIGYRVFEPFLI